MFKLALVGDLSMNDSSRLARTLDAALASADVVVQLGDIAYAYEAIKARYGSGKLLPIPGNHDYTNGHWDQSLSDLPKQWMKAYDEVVLVGLDNSFDTFNAESWALLESGAKQGGGKLPLFVAVHKALSPLILPDGTESQHIMGEGAPCPDAVKLQGWLRAHPESTVVCGHYHGWAMMQTPYATVILDGRGGAAPDLGYTLILFQPEGWTAHPVTVPAAPQLKLTPTVDPIVQLAGLTTLTKEDLEGLKACDAMQLAVLMRAYIDMGKVADRGVWAKVATILQGIMEYAPLAGLIFQLLPLL
jgi:predicted phosphodiesterase